MPIQLPTENPSKICTLNYACGHCRYFKIEEITSELTAPHDQNSAGEGLARFVLWVEVFTFEF
ncbi:hypothetical protein XANCAGTX0491_002833 [Xanthoria calcicola]